MAPKHSLLATIAALASVGVLIAGCGGDSGSDTSASTGATSTPTSTPSTSTPSTTPTDTTPTETTPGQTDTTQAQPPKELPLRNNTKITEAQLADVRDKMKLFTQCVRDTGATVSTEPKDVKGFGLRRAQGGLLRVTWKGGSDGADVVVLATTPNAKRTKASLTEQPKVVRKKVIVVAFDSEPTAAKTKTINECTTRANK